jgi:hypothetical protein
MPLSELLQIALQHFPIGQSISSSGKKHGFVILFTGEEQVAEQLVLRDDYILWEPHATSRFFSEHTAYPAL